MNTATEAAPPTARPAKRELDAWAVLSIGAAALFWLGATRPIGDPDVWWHVRTGDLILHHGIPHQEPWAFTAMGNAWTPTSWLSDVLFAGVHDVLGWRGLILVKLVAGAVLLASLYRVLFVRSGAPARLAAPVFVLTCITLSPFIAERPQLLSLCFLVWVAEQARKTMLGRPPSWWLVVVLYVWANIHGMWILGPAMVVLAAAGVSLDRPPGWAAVARRALGIAAASLAASALTPAGPRLTVAAFVVRRAASDVSEWQPTNLLDSFSIFLLLIFLLWIVAVARGPQPTPPHETLWMLCLFVFVLTAARNVAPVVIMMSPVVLGALDRTFGTQVTRVPSPPLLPVVVGWTIMVVAVCISIFVVASRPPLVAGLPSRIVADLKARPGTVRVLDSYVIGGYLTGEGAPKISVAIDGRTDNYDPVFVHRYFQATRQMVGWRELVHELKPDVAVIGRRSQLAQELERIGWRVTMTDGDWALLDRPAGQS
jgi:hypothetical protein